MGFSVACFVCAASVRRIGQRGSQTETMRDMIVLHYPLTRPSVATAFEMQTPARAYDEPEAITRRFRGADAPAGGRRARFQRRCRPQQKERQAGIAGGKLQSLAGSQIELVDRTDHGGGRARMQRFLDRPKRFLAVRSLDQDQAVRVEAERVQPMTMKMTMQ